MRLPLLLLGLAMLFASASRASEPPSILIEAENPVAIRSPFQKVVTQSGQASGGAYLLLPWDENKAKGSGSVVYKFNVQKPGVYFLWARTLWTPGQGNSVKVRVQPNDSKYLGQPKLLGEDGTYNRWHWVGGHFRVTLPAGENTLTLIYGETGVRIDQFLLTQETPNTSGPHRKVTR